jgi:sugar phosphate permease
MAMTPGAAPSRIFYGWWVALALSIIVFLSAGIRFTIGPFLKPVPAELGLDRGSFSLVISASLFLYGAFMPLVGRLVDRLGSRIVCTAGAVVMGASLVLAGRFGWRTSFVILGVASLCIMLPLTLWVLRDDPESMGLEPDGGPAAHASSAESMSFIERTAGWACRAASP